ncbi:MAG: flagellar motor switch protein FliN [Planctomycetota bacterium]|jgi:flagellar motor switch protein FliN/FliY
MAKDTDEAAGEAAEEKVKVQSAQFDELVEEARGTALSLDLVLDIAMPVTVELGRTQMTVQELLQLRTGSVVELDKMAGEPIDLYVRDVCFARGDVVVVDNNFGLRVSEIISPRRRISELGKGKNGVDKTNGR